MLQRLTLAIWVTGLSLPVWAETTPNPAPTYLSFDDAAKIALSENPDLLSLRDQEESLRLQAAQALAPNNPTFGVTNSDVPGFSPLAEGAFTIYTVAFTLGFPGKALSQSANVRHQSESLGEQAASKEIDILVALSNNYVSLAANAKLDKFLQDELKKATDLLKLLEKKYAAAQAAQVDLLNARVVVAGLQHDLLANQNNRAVLLTQFLNLIRKPGSTQYRPEPPAEIEIPTLPLSLDALTNLMLKKRHLLISAEKQLEATQAAVTTASLQPLPDLQLSGGMNVYNIPSAEPITGVSRDYLFGVTIAIPLFFPFNELTGIRAAAKSRDSAEEQLASQKLQAMADLQSFYTSFVSSNRDIENSVKYVIPATKASYDLTLLTYSLGKADYFVLNQARQTWIQAEEDLLSKQLNSAQLFNQIVQEVGCDFMKKEGFHACL